jgi:hypothetical protein
MDKKYSIQRKKKLKDESFLKKLFDIIIKSNLIDQP